MAAADKGIKESIHIMARSYSCWFCAVAAGAALKRCYQVHHLLGMAGGGSGGGSKSWKAFNYDRSGQSIDVSGSFRVEGQDLVLALGEANSKIQET